MFHKILVAMDSSEIGKHVFDEAVSLAKALSSSLMLLHVLAPGEEDSPGVPGMPNLDYYSLSQMSEVHLIFLPTPHSPLPTP
jgi:nucleotide-binding universal stress UspA family protein